MSCHTADSKPVKQEVNGTAILPPLVFPAPQILVPGDRLAKSEDGCTHPLKVSQKINDYLWRDKKNLRHDTKQNDTKQNTTQHNESQHPIQHNVIRHYDTKHNDIW